MFYDAMIAKLCSYAQDRRTAIDTMLQALDSFVIRGVSHNISFLQSIISSERFISGDISTKFIDNEYRNGFSGPELSDECTTVILCAAVFIFLTDLRRSSSISGQLRGARISLGSRWVIKLDNSNYPVTVRPIDDGFKISFENRRFYVTSKWVLGTKLLSCKVNGQQYTVQVEYSGRGLKLTFMGAKVSASIYTPRAAELSKFMRKRDESEDINSLISFMSGMIIDIKVKPGDSINKGQVVAIIEAMKMENILPSPRNGIVKAVCVSPGQTIQSGQVLIEIE